MEDPEKIEVVTTLEKWKLGSAPVDVAAVALADVEQQVAVVVVVGLAEVALSVAVASYLDMD